MTHEALITAENFTALGPAQLRILLVDDDAREVNLRARVMTSRGYNIRTATDPFLAIYLATKERLDVAVLDYDMPGMNGCVLADRLKERTPSLRIALYSGVLLVPQTHMQNVNLFVSKADGVFELLRRIPELLAPVTYAWP
jgi:CheY-like chemotaxis protein